MRKLAFFFLAAVMAVGCKSKAPVVSTKIDHSAQVGIKGNWKITNVTYAGSDYIKINSFDIAESKCFVGSTWSFISNNNKGNMVLNHGNCPLFNSPIVWSVNKDGQFILKIIEGTKAKKVKEGYVLKVANQTEKSFQLIDKVNVGGQMKDVVYQFEKNI